MWTLTSGGSLLARGALKSYIAHLSLGSDDRYALCSRHALGSSLSLCAQVALWPNGTLESYALLSYSTLWTD